MVGIERARMLGTDITGSKTSLTQRQIESLENTFDNLLEFGLLVEVDNEEVAQGLCNIFSCMNERRSSQYIMAFGNTLSGRSKAYRLAVAEKMAEVIKKFPQLKTEGMKNFVNHLSVVAKRSAAA